MRDILDTLISLIPVILALIWILRRIGRTRRRGRGVGETAREGPAKSELRGLAPERRGSFPVSKQKSKFTNDVRETGSLGPPTSPVEKEESGKQREIFKGQPIIAHSESEQGARVVKDRVIRTEPSGVRRRSLDGIQARSPLAQAMLWKIIFDRPQALKELDE